MAATRRLAAILAADVAGYSRLIGSDEQGTLGRLKAIRADVIDPAIAAHHDRIVKTTGDGVLAEFASTVDALRCAGEMQTQMAERNLALAPDTRTEFRIGIHQGDIVVEEDGDIFGDGVNIAARLEALAEPGGVCVSARVQEDAAGKLHLAFRDLGERQLKNIARPVRAYAIDVGVVRSRGLAVTSPPRQSIVVLPLTNLNNDPEQQYFADAITEDLTTDLSRIAGMFVISRNTAFTYRNKLVDTKQVSRELGVRYVLEGSVQRSGNRVRVTAQLIAAENDAHLWAERFDRETGDLFALQDEIASQLANALGVELIAAEAARATEHPDALDYILRGRAGKRTFGEAISSFERALELDPRSVEAQSQLAHQLSGRVLTGMPGQAPADLARAEGLVDRALAVSSRYAFAHFVKGQVLRAQERSEEAIPEYETAIALDRNLVAALSGLAWCKLNGGSIEDVIPLAEEAIRLSPRDPLIGVRYLLIGTVHLLQSHLDEAIVWFEKARSDMPAAPFVRSRLASAYALRGETERAAAELAEARRLSGEHLFSSIANLKTYPNAPKIRALYDATYFAGLRKAGMLDE